jgi:hypothetical protein
MSGSLTGLTTISATNGTISTLTDGTATLTSGTFTGLVELSSDQPIQMTSGISVSDISVNTLRIGKSQKRMYNIITKTNDFINMNWTNDVNIDALPIKYDDVSGGIFHYNSDRDTSNNISLFPGDFTQLSNKEGIEFKLCVSDATSDSSIGTNDPTLYVTLDYNISTSDANNNNSTIFPFGTKKIVLNQDMIYTVIVIREDKSGTDIVSLNVYIQGLVGAV